MANIKMTEINEANSNLLSVELTNKQCNMISGGIDLSTSAEAILGIVSGTIGQALNQGLLDLFGL